MKRFIAALLFAVTAACGSDSGGGSLGSVGGNSLTVKEAIFAIDQDILILLAGDRSGLCDIYGGSSTPSGKYVLLATTFINTNDGISTTPVVAGDYTVVAGLGSISAAGKYNTTSFNVADGCTVNSSIDATSGTFTLQQVGTNSSGSHTTGSVNLKFGADTLSGSVDATFCGALLTNSTPPTCP
jgi:hypothetical protein